MDRLRTLAKRWAAAADPEADERGYKAATDREFFDVSPTTGGCHLSGFLTTAHSQGLLVALQAVHGVPAADDDRTASQRRAGALSGLARLTLDHGLAGKGASVRPHISVLIDYPTLMSLATTAGAAHQINPTLLIPSPPIGGPLNPAVAQPRRAQPGRAQSGGARPGGVRGRAGGDSGGAGQADV